MEKQLNTGIFLYPQDKKKVLAIFLFLSIILGYLSALYTFIPQGKYTNASWFSYLVACYSTTLLFSFFTKKKELIVEVSGCVGVVSIIFFIGNFYIDYQKDFDGLLNLQLPCALLTLVTFSISLFRFIKFKTKK